MTRYVLAFTVSSLLLGNWAIGSANESAKKIQQLQAQRWEQLAKQTSGQCASPEGVGGCLYDSNEYR